MKPCEALGVPAVLEISRSGQGAHAWLFFAGRVSARDARRLGTAIIGHTCARARQLQLKSQYLAKNPGGYCPDHSCGTSFKSAQLQAGEKA